MIDNPNHLIGKKYSIIYQPNCEEKRKGGNGIVFDLIEIKEKNTGVNLNPNDYVVKIANVSHDTTKKERFQQAEILFITNNYQNLENVIEILDYDYIDFSWYLMKKYEEFDVKYTNDLLYLLHCLIDIGKAIKSIHLLPGGKAHRDIKPRNILVDKNGNVLLADFGCTFVGSYFSDGLTKRPIGPYLIRPPELDSCNRNSKLDYRRSDVYLFAKTCWMYIKRNSDGFIGEYRRNDRLGFYPNKHCKTYEPLHQMMERATEGDINKRSITIDECIDYLKVQIEIIEGTVKKELLRKMISIENNSRAIEDADIRSISLTSTNKLFSSIFSKNNYSIPFYFINSTDKGKKLNFIFVEFELTKDSGGKTFIKATPSNSFYSSVVFAVDAVSFNKIEEKIIVSISNSGDFNESLNTHMPGSTLYLDSKWELEIDNSYRSLDYLAD